jgi:uridine kinase
VVFVSVDEEEIVRRALARDVPSLGTSEEVERRYRARYIPGQRLYLETTRPDEHADAIVVNNDPARPVLTFRRAARGR